MIGKEKEIKHSNNVSIAWNRVHYLSPLLMFWKVLGILTGLVIHNLNQHIDLRYVYEEASNFSLYIAMGAGAFLLFIVVFCYLSWTRMGYAIDETNVYYKHGIMFKKERYIRLTRIQTVDIVYPVIGRIFGLGQIKIESAGSADSNIIIAYMKDEQLKDLRNTVLALMAGVKTENRNDTEHNDKENTKNIRYFDDTQSLNSKEKLGIHELKMYAKEAPEKQIYEIDYKKFVLATLSSFFAGILTLLFVFFGMFVFIFQSLKNAGYGYSDIVKDLFSVFSVMSISEFLQVFLSAGLVIIAILSAGLWKPLSVNFGYKLKISPDGFRKKSGLTSVTHETIPPNRIHALIITQPFMWRIFNAWKVKTIKAAVMEVTNPHNDDEIFVPFEQTRNINNLVHLVYKKLSNENVLIKKDEDIISEGLLGKKQGEYFKQLAPVGRLFHPFAYNRMAYYITDNVVFIRSGFLTRTLAVIPHERAQSLGIEQGIIGQKLGVAQLHMDLVKMSGFSKIPCLPVKEAKENLQTLNELFRIKRLAEPQEEWMKRVYKGE